MGTVPNYPNYFPIFLYLTNSIIATIIAASTAIPIPDAIIPAFGNAVALLVVDVVVVPLLVVGVDCDGVSCNAGVVDLSRFEGVSGVDGVSGVIIWSSSCPLPS